VSERDAEALRAAVREFAGSRILAVLDDDPTGSQSVHGVQVVITDDDAEYAAALGETSTIFVLTNTRSLSEADAFALTRRVAGRLAELADKLGRPLDLVSRSDSTLRGHVAAEIDALDEIHLDRHGCRYDAVLFAPAFFEAGRTTVDNIHRVSIDGVDVPAGETEYARDRTFGYRSSDLREFLAEASSGAIRPDDVASLSLEDIRTGGPEHVAARLRALGGGSRVVVNAERDEDYDIVALGVALARASGSRLLARCGPSFVRALAGITPRPPLVPAEIWTNGRRTGHGLIAVGSHVSGTSAQIRRLRARYSLLELEIDVTEVLASPERRDAHVATVGAEARAALAHEDVLIATSRSLAVGTDAETSLAIARHVAAALTDVVRTARLARPAWVIAKGGITSHELAVRGLGISRAEVVGQLGPGIISLLRPLSAHPDALGMPYVVFAGNVGSDDQLADVVTLLRERPG